MENDKMLKIKKRLALDEKIASSDMTEPEAQELRDNNPELYKVNRDGMSEIGQSYMDELDEATNRTLGRTADVAGRLSEPEIQLRIDTFGRDENVTQDELDDYEKRLRSQ